MSSRKNLLLASALVFTSLSSTAGYAADCKRVTFKFVNKWTVESEEVKIKVKKVSISGDKGAWDENIDNKVIQYDDDHSTKQRRLNKLSDGDEGSFIVHFDYKHPDGGWTSDTHGPFDITCNTGDPIRFTIMHNN